MKKYSIITEYKGGIFINQYEAPDIPNLLSMWMNGLDKRYFTISKRLQINNELNRLPLLIEHIKDLENVWRISFLIEKLTITLFVIETL